MIDRPTPETDALISVGLENADRECVPADFARKLERERDGAREQIEVCRGIIERTVIARNSALSDLTELERERDEAREDLEFRRGLYKVQEEYLETARRERDEALIDARKSKSFKRVLKETNTNLKRKQDMAQERIKELIYIAGRAIDLADIDYENDKFGVVSELRDGLEKIKEETK